MRPFLPALLILCILLLLPAVTQAQSAIRAAGAAPENLDSLLITTSDAIDQAVLDGTDVLSPDHFARASSAYHEADKLAQKQGDTDLIRIKLRLANEELQIADRAAQTVRERLGDLIAVRASAKQAGADSLGHGNWQRAEERFRDYMRAMERGNAKADEQAELRGLYLSVRRDALRTTILGGARTRIAEIEKHDGAKIAPILLLRAQQQVSRAEANIAQENLDSAKVQGLEAERIAIHAQALMRYLDGAFKNKESGEKALLAYDDLLEAIAQQLDGTLDFTASGPQAGSVLPDLISARQDSLLTLTANQQSTLISLEQSLAECQTSLANAQARLAELEIRVRAADSLKASAQASAAQKQALYDRISRARAVFGPAEASVVQDSSGNVIIRLPGSIFGTDATKLDKNRQKLLDRVVEGIRIFPDYQIRVEGHTDSSSEADQNIALSEKQAAEIATALSSTLGLPEGQIRAAGFGGTRPIASNAAAEGRARNRRIDVVLTPPRP